MNMRYRDSTSPLISIKSIGRLLHYTQKFTEKLDILDKSPSSAM